MTNEDKSSKLVALSSAAQFRTRRILATPHIKPLKRSGGRRCIRLNRRRKPSIEGRPSFDALMISGLSCKVQSNDNSASSQNLLAREAVSSNPFYRMCTAAKCNAERRDRFALSTFDRTHEIIRQWAGCMVTAWRAEGSEQSRRGICQTQADCHTLTSFHSSRSSKRLSPASSW